MAETEEVKEWEVGAEENLRTTSSITEEKD
jgi:hypothetical protein